ncbi:hypothetical protein LEP1GSC016_1788 [Leptospira borgpetersenii serovar Hardjo-bovis str. Sponselee]|uniref:Uncharacterized protein n=2 Tax=Leptospira borgpetersenii TaxID=174 RepID=M6BFZ8_LEPBO|nr:hypothetical protein LEP1GSC016_1788 [Leptospira borgpetersenii serovar Hardjo-bovis str. Sponselee]EMO60668.1 hypothetical protein LEP1GSC133_0954 [Leptospira borgpetersenii serovar Pomona str. 200901868]
MFLIELRSLFSLLKDIDDHSVVFGKEQKLYKSLSDVAQTFIE